MHGPGLDPESSPAPKCVGRAVAKRVLLIGLQPGNSQEMFDGCDHLEQPRIFDLSHTPRHWVPTSNLIPADKHVGVKRHWALGPKNMLMPNLSQTIEAWML